MRILGASEPRCVVEAWLSHPVTWLPPLVPQRFPRLQRMVNPLLRLALADQAQERLPLEVEQVLFRDGRRVRERSACHDRCQRAADQGVVVADASAAPGQVHAKLQGGEHAIAPDANRGPPDWWLIAFAYALERPRLRVREQPLPVHGPRVRRPQVAEP